ncbi:unnamed protein product [Blepharisma stoltei]|uniref:GOLD domain-containing protein n=1 Tax=Blepharisma stoltei TaxID=1481888 RepID=A0AAU9JHX0_9CILI|nr:unnamed protein product [Blepharisma stoltei]
MHFILFLLNLAQAVYFTLPGHMENCYYLMAAKGSEVVGAYVISGDGDQNVITRLFGPDASILYQSQRKTREGHFEILSENGGKYKFCFRAIDGAPKTVSFEYKTTDKVSEKELAKEEEIAPLAEGLTKMTKKLDMIYRNIHFYERREKVHRDLTERTCDRVIYSAILKILVLGLISLMQIYMLRRFFSNKGTSRV